MSAFRVFLTVGAAVLLPACGLATPAAGVEVASGPEAVDGTGDASSGDRLTPAGAPTSDVQRANGQRPNTVAVVGDSLTASAVDEIESALDDLDLEVVAIDGLGSRRIARGVSIQPGLEAVETIEADADPELWVIALGTNDVGAQASTEMIGDDVATIVAEIPDGVPVVWVDIWIRDLPDEVRSANAEIRRALADRPLTAVVDWHSNGGDPGLITGDGVHLTDRGRQSFADSISGAVESFLAD